jgi:hypothetical protein
LQLLLRQQAHKRLSRPSLQVAVYGKPCDPSRDAWDLVLKPVSQIQVAPKAPAPLAWLHKLCHPHETIDCQFTRIGMQNTFCQADSPVSRDQKYSMCILQLPIIRDSRVSLPWPVRLRALKPAGGISLQMDGSGRQMTSHVDAQKQAGNGLDCRSKASSAESK